MGDKRSNGNTGAFIAIGLGTGVALGFALDNFGLGLALGLAVGLIISGVAARRGGGGAPSETRPRDDESGRA